MLNFSKLNLTNGQESLPQHNPNLDLSQGQCHVVYISIHTTKQSLTELGHCAQLQKVYGLQTTAAA